MTTAHDVIRRALRLIGVTATGEAMGADEAQDALSALNALLAELPEGLRPVTLDQAYEAMAGDDMAVVAESAISITLPADPADGWRVRVFDANGTFAAYPVTIRRNGRKIVGAAADAVLSVSNTDRTYEYRQDLGSWVVVPATYALAETINLPPGLTDALVYALALRIAPEFGAPVSAVVATQGSQGERRLKARTMQPSQPVPVEYF